MDEIINKVATSKLEVFDLEDHYPKGIRSSGYFTMATGRLLLKEKSLGTPENHDWTQYQGQFVAVNCSTDAIVPAWASILVTIQLAFATKIVDGNIDDLNAALYEELLAKIDFSAYVNKSIIIKAVRKAGSYVPMYWPHNIYNLCP
jgi:hypothetical protein